MLETLALIFGLLWAVFTTISVSIAVIVLGALLFFILIARVESATRYFKEKVFNERA
jgi:mannose/fructose/N-acetylgalactosamine-specific phosphotransferase system component IID